MRRKRATNVCGEQTESLTGNTEPPQLKQGGLSFQKWKAKGLGSCSQQAKGLQTEQHLFGYKDRTTSCLSWDTKCLIPDRKQTQNWILAASSQQAWGDHRIQHNYLFCLTSQAIIALEQEEWISCHSSCCRNVQAASCQCPGSSVKLLLWSI